jgi:aminopeptidase C
MAGAHAAMDTANQQARTDALQQLAANQIQRQQSGLNFFNAQTNLQAQSLATRQQNLATMLQQNQIQSGREGTFNALNKFYQNFGG